jgi:minichromosome maintenance protein 10
MGLESASVMHRKKTAAAYDPSRQWGLRPEGHRGQTETDGGGATYVVQGHVVSRNSQLAAPPKPVGETVGREAQSRAKRKRGAREEKEVGKALDESVKGSASVSGSSRKDKGKGRGRSTAEDEEDDDDEDDSKHDQRPEAPAMSASRTAFSTSMIRTLGFDPTTRPAAGKAGPVDAEVKRKVCAFVSFRHSPLS